MFKEVTLFSKLFSRKSDEATVGNHQEIIEQTLASYRSDSFPQGVSDVCQSLTINTDYRQTTVAITVPFPCVSELQVIADNLSQS